MQDLTIIYITANVISDFFGRNMREHLLVAANSAPMIVVSKKPVDFWANFSDNIILEGDVSHFNIYRQALAGAKAAKTKYIAIAEDDVLYSPEHFKRRPSRGKFAYNIACWGMYTWIEPATFSYRAMGARRNHGMLICERELYIEAMEERFAKYPDDDEKMREIWAEPGKYEEHLGVTVRESETFYTLPANVKFSHSEELSYHTIGRRKRQGELRALEIDYWGRAENIKKLYG